MLRETISPKTQSPLVAVRTSAHWRRFLTLSFIASTFLVLGPVSSDVSQGAAALARFTYTEYHMGVDARLVVYAPDRATAENACTAAFAEIARLDTMMSDYRVDSELNLLCKRAGGPPVRISKELFEVLQRAQKVSRQSKGAFDVTVGPLVGLWRRARKSGVMPSPSEIDRARRLVGWRNMVLDPRRRTVKLLLAGMKLDLGGIAKGYADDCAQKVLKRFGVQRALVEMGGDIVVSGPPPRTKGWTIRVPNAENGRGLKILHFANCAVSTSGDTEQFVIIGGKRYSHVIDPRTGMALTNRVESTIVARDGLTSDPLSKVLAFLTGAERRRFLKAYPGTKYFVRELAQDDASS